MLSKPPIDDTSILTALHAEYGLSATELTFLPLGADLNTAVYHVVTQDGASLFLKLRKSGFDPITVDVPAYLAGQGFEFVIPPLKARTQGYWAGLDAYRMILYPFIVGKDAYELALSDQQWLDFGAALRDIHKTQVPQPLARRIPRETYSPRWREAVKKFQVQIEQTTFEEPTAAKLAAFMKETRHEISRLVERAGKLAHTLRLRELKFVLCHADIHPGNLLVGADGAFHIVDWDNPILAPKERDLGMIGGGSVWNSAREIDLFYKGYGPAQVDGEALAYYRYERIVQDIAAFCEQLFLSNEGGDDREQAYSYFASSFLPGHELDLARQGDEDLPE